MQFQFNSECFFCGQPAINQAKRKSPEVISVRTIVLKEKILAVCRQRGDYWGATVQARLLPVHDLHAVDAGIITSAVTTFKPTSKSQLPIKLKQAVQRS